MTKIKEMIAKAENNIKKYGDNLENHSNSKYLPDSPVPSISQNDIQIETFNNKKVDKSFNFLIVIKNNIIMFILFILLAHDFSKQINYDIPFLNNIDESLSSLVIRGVLFIIILAISKLF